MLSVNGFTTNNLTTTGLYNIDADEINADSVNCDTFLNQSSSLFTGVSSNLQTQINTINSLVSVGQTGGGYFSILGGLANGFSTTNPFFNFGGAGVSAVNVPVVQSFPFKVTSITFTCQTTPANPATVHLYKNGSNVYTMEPINAVSKTFNNINISYLANDTLNLYTVSGSGGALVRATISCQVGGVTGATPQLTVGTVSNLAFGSTPTVSITGTTLNPVLNFGLVTGSSGINGTNGTNGATGAKGDKGDTGAQGEKGEKGDTGASGGLDPATALVITGLVGTVGGLVTAVATIEGEIGALQGEVGTLQTEVGQLQTDVGTINDEIEALQGKTQYMTCNTTTTTTSFASKLTTTDDITTSGKVIASSDITTATKVIATGDITTSGKVIATDDITTSAKVIATGDITSSGNISSNNCTLGGTLKSSYIDGTSTGVTSVTIGHVNSVVDYTNVNINGTLYVNGILYVPFNSVSSFLNQF